VEAGTLAEVEDSADAEAADNTNETDDDLDHAADDDSEVKGA
jgi:hypothetical protein